ncbi:methylmalonyl-CoA epimerase [Salicibibacter halophilus]|uniref:Methylmalonyl-CoA epimerase n=1 Tax=Salicibibacter halophilus TaxID=2502791 RepID=A0A514LM38_9BACI|nr:methylmalonyl-CoA epimerase [Salicibibacter halophilus]QDI92932.1 methylmalonyl-CoA epimerase [Salicibibacter halophilus]
MNPFLKKVDHVGIAVHSIEERLPYYQDLLGFELTEMDCLVQQEVKVAFLSSGEIDIELLEPIRDGGAVARFLSRKGEGIHHFALQVDDLESCLQAVNEKNASACLGPPVPGARGRTVAFLDPKLFGGVLVELCQRKNERCAE